MQDRASLHITDQEPVFLIIVISKGNTCKIAEGIRTRKKTFIIELFYLNGQRFCIAKISQHQAVIADLIVDRDRIGELEGNARVRAAANTCNQADPLKGDPVCRPFNISILTGVACCNGPPHKDIAFKFGDKIAGKDFICRLAGRAERQSKYQ